MPVFRVNSGKSKRKSSNWCLYEPSGRVDRMVLDKYVSAVERTDPVKYVGKVKRVQGILVESTGPSGGCG
jgi:hypothetical protein